MFSTSGRGRQALYYGVPMAFCLAVHFLGLKMWFFGDDFAWLGLRLEIQQPRDLIHVLFAPEAQGTVRTLSERLFFLVFSTVFGLESPPFRIWVFLTQFANIMLLMQIARRLTGSAAAGFFAAILWTGNAALALALGWSAAYNEVAYAFFILLAFRLLLAYIDTGQRKYWIWQWVAFLLGFGALELNVIYPALAAGYALCCARQYFRKTLPLFIPSAIYTAVHFAFVPPSTDPHYAMHFGPGIFTMLWKYWAFGLGALRDGRVDWRPLWLGVALTVLITSALAIFGFQKVRRREWLPLFLIGWFLVALGPLLPLTEHFTEYYLTVPLLGIAILASWALSSLTKPALIGAAAVVACMYLTVSICDIHSAQNYYYKRSRQLKYLIKALQEVPHTDKKIMLSGIDNDLFWTGFCDDPFRLLDIWQIYLVPGSEKRIEQHPEWGCEMSKFFIGIDPSAAMLRNHQAVVYKLEGRHLRDVTAAELKAIEEEYMTAHPEVVDVADPVYQNRLGASWYPPEKGFRWMPKAATVEIAGPKHAGQVLEVTGYCPALVVAKGPLKVTFRADGTEIETAVLEKPDQPVNLQFPMPATLIGRPMIEITIEVSRTVQAGADVRPLGMIFSTFRMK